MDDERDEIDLYLDEDEPQERYWTPWRVAWLIIALLVIAAMIAYLLWPFLYQIANPLPPPPTPPLGRI